MAKSTRQQLADLDAAIAKLQVRRAALAQATATSDVDPDTVQAGMVVSFLYGKGEGRKTLRGTVVGRRDPEEGKKGGSFVKIAVGEGFDATLVSVCPNFVTVIHEGGTVPAPHLFCADFPTQ